MTANKNQKKLLKTREVCQQLGINPATLKAHFKAGLIEAITINTHRYYTQEAIDKYLENGKKNSKKENTSE